MRTLIIGYGNADRQDDGAAWYVLTGLARRLGRPVPDLPEDGFIPEGAEIDLWYVLQLVPEMSEEMSQYERICYVDCHTGAIAQEILLQPVDTSAASSALSHIFTPAACLALIRTVYARTPEAKLLSVRGYQFGFARELSPATAALVDQAIDTLWDWIHDLRIEE